MKRAAPGRGGHARQDKDARCRRAPPAISMECRRFLRLRRGPPLAEVSRTCPGGCLFQLSLVDHIRLSFGSVATSYRAHARAAERLATRARQSRIVLVVLLGLATGASLLALTGVRPFQIAAAALSATALVGLAVGARRSNSRSAPSRIGPARRSSGCSARSIARSSPRSTTG